MNILAIEASTSAAKTLIYSSKEKLIYNHSIPYPSSISNLKIQDPEGILRVVFQCVKEILEVTEITVDIIALASVWHSMLLLDHNRKPIDKIRTWADTEGAFKVAQYRNDERLRAKTYYNTGCNIHCKYPAWRFAYMKEAGLLPLPEDKMFISSLPEYMFERLTGKIAVAKTTASGSGFLNIHTLDWDENILAFLGLKKDQFSSLEEIEYTGKLQDLPARELGLTSGIPVTIPSADGALNQIGEGALRPESMTISIGTSAALRLTVNETILPKNPATWCYYPGVGKRLVGAATSGAGSCIEWFTKKMNLDQHNFAQFEAMLERVSIKNAPIFLPFINGEQSPGWHENRMGGFYRVKDDHILGDMYYSVLEGVLFNIYQCYEALEEMQSAPAEIILSGGITNSEYWMQMMADIFQQKIYISTMEHSSIRGAICIAKKVSGELDSLLDVKREKNKIINPKKENKVVYEQRYKIYKRLYEITEDLIFMNDSV